MNRCFPMLPLLLVLAPSAAAQSFNVDVDVGPFGSAAPSSAFGGAAVQPGFWNSHNASFGSTMLVDLSGAPTVVSLNNPPVSSFMDGALGGDVGLLLNDVAECDVTQASQVEGPGTAFTFHNLALGNYRVVTYATGMFAPTDVARVTVPGSTDPPQSIAALQSDPALASAVHHVVVDASILTVIITAPNLGPNLTNFAYVNGFQLEWQPLPFTPYCFGDGTGTACPCSNFGAAGNGCANSLNPSGARLWVIGSPSVTNDTLVLEGSGMPNASCLYFQGTTQFAVPFGDGLRCTGGTVIRIGIKSNVGGASRYPEPGDLPVSTRGLIPATGGVRQYQCWYRNSAAFCSPAAFNLTSGAQVSWQP